MTTENQSSPAQEPRKESDAPLSHHSMSTRVSNGGQTFDPNAPPKHFMNPDKTENQDQLNRERARLITDYFDEHRYVPKGMFPKERAAINTSENQEELKPWVSVQPEWCLKLPIQQQSVLLLAARGPDGIPKSHPCKDIQRAYRGTVLLAAAYGRLLEWGEKADSFMSLDLIADDERWAKSVDSFFNEVDSLPHHFTMHLLHGAEILGYKHPDLRFACRWYDFYARGVRDAHMQEEELKTLDIRLGDWNRQHWNRRAEPSKELPPFAHLERWAVHSCERDTGIIYVKNEIETFITNIQLPTTELIKICNAHNATLNRRAEPDQQNDSALAKVVRKVVEALEESESDLGPTLGDGVVSWPLGAEIRDRLKQALTVYPDQQKTEQEWMEIAEQAYADCAGWFHAVMGGGIALEPDAIQIILAAIKASHEPKPDCE